MAMGGSVADAVHVHALFQQLVLVVLCSLHQLLIQCAAGLAGAAARECQVCGVMVGTCADLCVWGLVPVKKVCC